MRWLALGLLVVINVVLLLWQVLVLQPQQPRPKLLPDVGELRLVSELAPSAIGDAAPAEPGPAETGAPFIAAPEPDEQTGSTASGRDGAPDPAVGVSLAKDPDDPPSIPDSVSPDVAESPAGETGKAIAAQLATAPQEAGAPLPETPVGAPAEEAAEGDVAGVLSQAARAAQARDGVAEAVPVSGEAAQPATLPEAPQETPLACWQLGPFESQEAAGELAQRLPEGVRQLRLETGSVKVPNGFYVLIPPLADRDEALQVERSLKQKGIEDSWVFVSGPLKNAVSLGLFNREINARRRLQRVEARGFEPEMRPRFRREAQTLLLVIGPEGGPTEDALAQLGGGDPESIPCPR